jgi:oligopeptide/dipeptide ABC transporter ATP-binding protein
MSNSSDSSEKQASKYPVLEVTDLKKHFVLHSGIRWSARKKVYAVDGVSFSIRAGETLGLVGESGCGKSTVGMSLLRLIEPTDGTVKYNGADITRTSRPALRQYRRHMQMVFQDPYNSVNPRMTIGDIIAEPLNNFKAASKRKRQARVKRILRRVGLKEEHVGKFPHQMSGGQLQRVGIARALALKPGLVVCDEVVSALDVSVQAQVLNLLMDLQDEYGFSYLFITHDLSVVEHISHRIAVMYLGKIVELADRRSLFENPLHPYTRALLDAAPVTDPRHRKKRLLLSGDVPNPVSPPKGCRFHTRCPFAVDRCQIEEPVLEKAAMNHFKACHLNDLQH